MSARNNNLRGSKELRCTVVTSASD